MQHIHTHDLEEAVQSVQQVYCAHRLRLRQVAKAIDTDLAISGPSTWPVVRLSYGARVDVDAGDFKDLFLIMRCLAGEGGVRQDSSTQRWQPGRTIPVSANRGTAFEFGIDFSQVTIRPDKGRLESLCSRWLGHPLDDDLRFELRPLSPAMEHSWGATLALIEAGGNDLPRAAEMALEEFVLSLLLKGHPHNFSEDLARPERPPHSRLVRRAEHYVDQHDAALLTVSDVAAGLGVSVRTLQAGFQEWRQITPGAYLRDVRMGRARDALLKAEPEATVTQIALGHGFVHLGRFAERYKARYGETPLATLSRTRRTPR